MHRSNVSGTSPGRPNHASSQCRQAGRMYLQRPGAWTPRQYKLIVGRIGGTNEDAPRMKYKQLAQTEIQIPEIGLGTWHYNGGVGPLKAGIDLGATFID